VTTVAVGIESLLSTAPPSDAKRDVVNPHDLAAGGAAAQEFLSLKQAERATTLQGTRRGERQ